MNSGMSQRAKKGHEKEGINIGNHVEETLLFGLDGLQEAVKRKERNEFESLLQSSWDDARYQKRGKMEH